MHIAEHKHMGKTAVLLLLIHPSLANKNLSGCTTKIVLPPCQKTLVREEVVVKHQSPCTVLLNHVPTGLAPKFILKIYTAILHQHKKVSVWEQFET